MWCKSTEEWRDGLIKIKWSGQQEHGVAETAKVGYAMSPARPTPAVSHSVFRTLSSLDNAVSGSAGLAPNAADGIVLPLKGLAKRLICLAVASL
ncbi:MAG: hypothetical protein NC453_24750 [Muribaculum sp.]|nr:hypothetical protein [Muribaculum sp.]